MTTYKCDIKMQYGKYSSHVWNATDRPGEPIAKDLGSSSQAIDKCIKAVEKSGFDKGDEVIFRDSSFASLSELRHVMSRAPY